MTVTTDSPYPQTKTYERHGLGQLVLKCEGTNPHIEDCLVQRVPDIGGLEAAFLACNHTGAPAPASFYAAMDTKGCGNFLMFRCKAGCSFSPDAITSVTAAGGQASTKTKKSEPTPVTHSLSGIARAPRELLGSWRTLQVSSHYQG